MHKDTAVQRKPSSVSSDSCESRKDNVLKDNIGAGNWSCNARDSGHGTVQKDRAGVKPGVQEQNWSSNARDDVVPPKQPFTARQDCDDFDFKIVPPTGLYYNSLSSPIANSLYCCLHKYKQCSLVTCCVQPRALVHKLDVDVLY